MATNDLIGESRPHNHRFVPAAPAAVMRILSRYDRPRLAAFVAVAIDLLDVLDGDADLEPNGDDEPTGDEQDAAYVEWTSLRGNQRGLACSASANEDDEQDDFDEDSFDQEYVEEREDEEVDACDVPPIWPGEGPTE